MYKNQELAVRATAIITQVIVALKAENIEAFQGESYHGSALCMKCPSCNKTIFVIKEEKAGHSWDRKLTGKLVIKFETIRLQHVGNQVATQLSEDSKNLITKLVAKTVVRMDAIQRNSDLVVKTKEVDKQHAEGIASLIEAHPNFKNNIRDSCGVSITFSWLSLEEADRILSVLDTAGVIPR